MAEICQICNKKIGLMDHEYKTQGLIMHYHCLPTFEADPKKYVGKVKKTKELAPSGEDWSKEEKSKGMVLTDIDLPFGKVFWVTVQFFGAGLIIAIPIWIIFFLIISS